jgi:hypothetical protein
MKPLAFDLCCGLGGWAEGFLAEGYEVIGFDVERRPYPGHLVLQDVRTLDGSRFCGASVIVASPPCQEFSYRDLPWGRLRTLPEPDLSIWRACERIAREADRPLVIENVRGAQAFFGKAEAHLLPSLKANKGIFIGNHHKLRRTADNRSGPDQFSSSSPRRKQFAAEAAKIPFELARHVAAVFRDEPLLGVAS